MKKIIFLVAIMTLISCSLASAETLKKMDYRDNIFVVSNKQDMPYNSAFTLHVEIERKCGLKESTPQDNDFSIRITFKPINKDKTEIIQPLSSTFSYKKTNDDNSFKGYFSSATSSYNSAYGTGAYSIYGDNEEGYEVLEHYEAYAVGPSFLLFYWPSVYCSYSPSVKPSASNDIVSASGERLTTPTARKAAEIVARKAEKQRVLEEVYSTNKPPIFPNEPKDKNIVFGEMLMSAAAEGSGMEISIPYAKDKSNVTEVKYLTVILSPEILTEWNEVFRFNPEEERKKLPI